MDQIYKNPHKTDTPQEISLTIVGVKEIWLQVNEYDDITITKAIDEKAQELMEQKRDDSWTHLIVMICSKIPDSCVLLVFAQAIWLNIG